MNYQRIYDQLIERSKTRIPPEGYIEHHHIVPRCMNGSDDKSNIAILTPEEHFVAHVLLVKIYPEVPELIVAVSRMCKGKGRKRRRLYGWLRRRHAEYMKLNQSGKGNSQHGTMWITNGTENKKISKFDKIPINWKIGRNMECLETVKHCKECGTSLGKRTRKQFCINCKNLHKIRRHNLYWITDGKNNKLISGEIQFGWYKGMIKLDSNKDRQQINNGIINKCISKSEEIPVGWTKGFIKCANNRGSLLNC